MGDVNAKVSNLEALMAKIASLPAAQIAAVEAVNHKTALEFASRISTLIPLSAEPKADGVRLVSTLKVFKGKVATGWGVSIGDGQAPYPYHLEYGFMDHGHHVPGAHFWWPTKYFFAKANPAKISRASNRALKKIFTGSAP